MVTEALLTRRIQQDPLLQGVGLVILDEFHERSVHVDLALAFAFEVRRARGDLAILVMSATLDADPVSRSWAAPRAGTFDALPGPTHPVQTRYQPLGQAGRWEEGFADGLARLFDETEGDTLAFLPGAGEIRRVGARLGGLLGARAAVLPLHGTMRLEEQRRVIRPQAAPPSPGAQQAGTRPGLPDAPRRVILATSLAETSLTVPNIRTVADAGWARLSPVLARRTGLDGWSPRGSARHRRSAARTSGQTQRPLRPILERVRRPGAARRSRDPQVRSVGAGAGVHPVGARDPGRLSWLDAPPLFVWQQAWEILRMLDLVEDAGSTELGRTVSGLGLSPRLGVLVTRGAARNTRVMAAACAAILQERDGSGLSGDPDFRTRLELIRVGRGGTESWRRTVATEMERILRRSASAGSSDHGWTAEQEEKVGNLLAYAFPDRIARREPDGTYPCGYGPGRAVSRVGPRRRGPHRRGQPCSGTVDHRARRRCG